VIFVLGISLLFLSFFFEKKKKKFISITQTSNFRYSVLVDKYIPLISSSLQDKNELVRRQTLTMITRLLQEDYLKWKGSLFFRFITSVVDDSEEIKKFGLIFFFFFFEKKFFFSNSNSNFNFKSINS